MRQDEHAQRTSGFRALHVLIADTQPLVGTALAALLAAEGHHVHTVPGDAGAVMAGLAGADLAILDIDIPGGAALLAALHGQRWPPVIVLAPSPDHSGLSAALDSGAEGLALKSEGADMLRLCIAAVAAGGHWVDSKALAKVVDLAQAQRDDRLLTRRERDVARLVATGQRNRAIACTLGIAEGTVKMHLHNVYAKLGLETRTQLAMDERMRTG